jgi:hypothetical protein
MDNPNELERLRNYKPSIDDLKMRTPIILQKDTASFEQTTLYAFLYNPMIHESGYITVSIHRTREGAEKALEWHKNEAKKEYEELFEGQKPSEFPFDWSKSWKVEEIQIKD